MGDAKRTSSTGCAPGDDVEPAGPDVELIGRIFREECGRSIASLVAAFGDLDLAEESVQDAFVKAVAFWPERGLPPNPGAWITATARNRAIDVLRRESTRSQRHERAWREHRIDDFDDPGGEERHEGIAAMQDDRLRLIFTCCHPALRLEAQVALTLRLLGGLSTEEIARAFLVAESTMAQRIVRAKAKIRQARIPYRAPRRRAPRADRTRCWRCSISSSTRGTWRRADPNSSVTTSPRKRSAWPGSWSS
ncbi:MAG: sigma-70 family RNA polymerase sigma factor [Ilumatobacteraceae bacterium]